VSIGLRDYRIGKPCPPAVLIAASRCCFAVFAVFAGNYQRAGTSPPQESWVSDDPAAKEQRDNSERTAALDKLSGTAAETCGCCNRQ
jgi:hypothetical protein